ncbi:MAG: HTTM domain-containing protein [Deltaproteobacteria bacterium]|nr:HTTM domain-containing protein [Deltaproteobacteria bacterium]
MMAFLQRWLFGVVDGSIYGLLRLFFGLSGVCKFTGMTSPAPRLVKGGFDLGLPLHRYGVNSFSPGVLPSDLGAFFQPSLETYRSVEAAALIMAVVVVCGAFSRLSTLLFAGCCWWLLLVDPAGFKHNLFALAVFGLLIGLSPCGDRFSLDSVVLRFFRGPRPARLRLVFSLRLVQVQLAVIYLFSTAVKLNDGWATGHLLGYGRHKGAARAVDFGLDWAVPLMTWGPLYAVGSWITVVVEAFLIVDFFSRRTRTWALFLGVCLHTAIDLGVDVGSYSLTMFAVYVAWLSPAPRQHHVVAPPRAAFLIRALDWFARFDVVTGDAGSAVRWKEVALRLPLTFPAAFVLDRAARLRERWRRRQAGSAAVDVDGHSL